MKSWWKGLTSGTRKFFIGVMGAIIITLILKGQLIPVLDWVKSLF